MLTYTYDCLQKCVACSRIHRTVQVVTVASFTAVAGSILAVYLNFLLIDTFIYQHFKNSSSTSVMRILIAFYSETALLTLMVILCFFGHVCPEARQVHGAIFQL